MRARRVLRAELRMADFDYDLFVIGAGSGGLATAKRAASYGARTAIAEQDRVGGTCVIRGCIPKKLMVYAAELGEACHDAEGYGWTSARNPVDWSRLVERRDAAVEALERAHEGHLSRAGVELVRGKAVLAAPAEVLVGERRVRARNILIATGSAPVLPAIGGIEHALTSDEFFLLREQPADAVLIGSGYIAIELACILAGLGTRVALLIRGELPLREFDADLRVECLAALRAKNIDVRTTTTVEAMEPIASGVRLRLRSGGEHATLDTERAVVFAVGRNPRTAGIGLEHAGVATGADGEVLVDALNATSVPNIFAVGDVTDRVPLTPVAIQAGRALADRVFGGKSAMMTWDNIPTAVFSDPPIATVGWTEAQAMSELGPDNVAVHKAGFTPLYHTLTSRKTRTMVKLVVDRRTDRVVGCHMIGRDAPEIVQGFAVALKAGATKAIFDATVGIHPSSAEELVTLP